MPTIIPASTPEEALAVVVKIIRHEQEKFTAIAAHRSTIKAKGEYNAKAATCDHLATIFEDVIFETAKPTFDPMEAAFYE
jgi:hypothetical protein